MFGAALGCSRNLKSCMPPLGPSSFQRVRILAELFCPRPRCALLTGEAIKRLAPASDDRTAYRAGAAIARANQNQRAAADGRRLPPGYAGLTILGCGQVHRLVLPVQR